MAFSARVLDELRSRTRLSDLVSRSGVKLTRRGREFVGLCPFHRERTPSFTVADDKGFFHCFGCGVHGDVFSFVARTHKLDFHASVEKIAAGLGSAISAALLPAARLKTDRHSEDEERNRRLAWRLWSSALEPRGTPIETYLNHRGLELPSMPVLRWAPRCWNRETGRELPAMLARVDNARGDFVAVHRTWLMPEGRKAKLEKPKMSLAPTGGSAVRLAPAAPALLIGEGVETCLAAMQATGQPGWAALSTGGLVALVLPSMVRTVIILADHDDNGAGQRAARTAAQRLLAEGRRVRIAMPPAPGTDIADVLAGHAYPRIAEVCDASG
jgi:phage/plasmid primase-like uncharacterized protein